MPTVELPVGVAADDERLGDAGEDRGQPLVRGAGGDDLVLVARRAVAEDGVAQAIDRAHRIGQTRPVFAYRLIARGTVEEKIVELQKTKRHLADAIITADKSLAGSLTAEDLGLLLS